MAGLVFQTFNITVPQITSARLAVSLGLADDKSRGKEGALSREGRGKRWGKGGWAGKLADGWGCFLQHPSCTRHAGSKWLMTIPNWAHTVRGPIYARVHRHVWTYPWSTVPHIRTSIHTYHIKYIHIYNVCTIVEVETKKTWRKPGKRLYCVRPEVLRGIPASVGYSWCLSRGMRCIAVTGLTGSIKTRDMDRTKESSRETSNPGGGCDSASVRGGG